MIITNKSNLPEALVNLVTPYKHNEPGKLSATTLLKGVREIILTDRHWDELTEDARDRVWATFGTAVHEMLRQEAPEEFTEEYLEHNMGAIFVTGKIDNYNMRTGIITDYKTASVWKWKFADFRDWDLQGLIYAWLLRKNGFPVNGIRFVAFLKDFSERDAQRDEQYPQSPAMIHETPMAYYEQLPGGKGGIDDYIKWRVKQYIDANIKDDNELPDCTDQETWAKPAKWAVMKQGRKSALKVCDTEKEALLIIGDLRNEKENYIQYRPGERPKCERYCSAAPFCNTYKKYLAQREAGNETGN